MKEPNEGDVPYIAVIKGENVGEVFYHHNTVKTIHQTLVFSNPENPQYRAMALRPDEADEYYMEPIKKRGQSYSIETWPLKKLSKALDNYSQNNNIFDNDHIGLPRVIVLDAQMPGIIDLLNRAKTILPKETQVIVFGSAEQINDRQFTEANLGDAPSIQRRCGEACKGRSEQNFIAYNVWEHALNSEDYNRHAKDVAAKLNLVTNSLDVLQKSLKQDNSNDTDAALARDNTQALYQLFVEMKSSLDEACDPDFVKNLLHHNERMIKIHLRTIKSNTNYYGHSKVFMNVLWNIANLFAVCSLGFTFWAVQNYYKNKAEHNSFFKFVPTQATDKVDGALNQLEQSLELELRLAYGSW